MEASLDLTVNDLAAKFRSKSELYNVLAREGGIYLPPKQDSTQKFLRSILLGAKLYVKWEDVKVIKVPQHKGLQVKDLLKFAGQKINISKYLPDYEYSKEPNREWLWNLINSLITKEFQVFIKERVERRKIDLIESQNMGIWAKPEFINVFKKSQAVSTMKGKSHFLVRMPKITKDRRIINDLEEKKEENDSKMISLIHEIDELKEKIHQLEDNQRDNEDNLDKLAHLYKLGLIAENGMSTNNEMN